MNNENLQVNQTEQPKPVLKIKKVSEWKRTTFDFHEGKAWCYKKMEPCNCATFIENKKQEATRAINDYKGIIEDCGKLMTQLEIKTEIFNNDFKKRRLNEFIQQLEKRRNDAINSKKTEGEYLLLYNEWETKLNQQLEKNE